MDRHSKGGERMGRKQTAIDVQVQFADQSGSDGTPRWRRATEILLRTEQRHKFVKRGSDPLLGGKDESAE